MKLLIILSLFITNVFAKLEHLPVEIPYRPAVDTGYTQYGGESLHFRNSYSLTFDDGPHPTRTNEILDILKKYHARATFFILTEKLNTTTLPIIKRILDEGHILASHGEVHHRSSKITKELFKKNLKDSLLKLKTYADKAGHNLDKFYYRFPYADYGTRNDYHHMNVIKEVSLELFNENCIHFAFWDIDSGDWIPSLTSNEVFKNILAYQYGGEYISYSVLRRNGRVTYPKKYLNVDSPTRGGVILFHDIQEKTPKGVESFLKYAQENSLEIIPLNEVKEFSYDGLNCSFQ